MTGNALLGALLVATALCGCATTPPAGPATPGTVAKPYVRRLDYRRTPELKDLAERARQFANQTYPAVCRVLDEDPAQSPTEFSLTFRPRLIGDNRGLTVGPRIYLNGAWLKERPDSLETILVHELAHVAQAYRWYPWRRSPTYWMEGIADYVRFKLGYTNVLGCPKCSVGYPHYTRGFACAGAFLLYLDTTYGPTVVRRLNKDLNRGRYSEQVFVETTGKDLAQLWTEFQSTPGFTPVAAAVNRLYETLGYHEGKPPRGVEHRFKAYLQRNGEPTDLHPAVGSMTGRFPKDVLGRYAVYKYLHLPGGPLDAARALRAMWEQGHMPGFEPEDHGQMEFGLEEGCDCESFPLSRTFGATKEGEPGITYHYTITQESPGARWILQKAWRTGAAGTVEHEYEVP